MPNVLIVNGSLGGSRGNTAELLALAENHLGAWAQVDYLELCRMPSLDRIMETAHRADAFLFGTGTYWDSWSSCLQMFLEATAHTEGSEVWMGKPAAVVVTAHAVGAKSVLSRLMGVLNAYGMAIPPFGGLTYTWAVDVALQRAPDHLKTELWTPLDVDVLCHNLQQAVEGGRHWKCWPTSKGRSLEKWLRAYSDGEGTA